MKSYRCPRCGQQTPDWQPVHLPCLIIRLRFVLFGIFGIFLILGLVFYFPTLQDLLFGTLSSVNQNELPITNSLRKADPIGSQDLPSITQENRFTPEKTSIPLTYTPTIEQRPTGTTTLIRNTITSIPTRFPTSTLIPSPTNSNCPGAPNQRVEIDMRAWVCTKKDRLIVRSSPNRSKSEITRLDPGKFFKIIDGPICANNWSWWRIKTDDGDIGWVAEGGDFVDPYFICPPGSDR